MPPRPAPALAAAARWCQPVAEPRAIAELFGATWPPPADAPGAGWRRETADLLVAAHPDQAPAWCRRPLPEAEHPARSRARHARLLAAAAAADPLAHHAADLRRTGRAAWALDVWSAADAALAARLSADVVQSPSGGHPAEARRRRTEAAMAVQVASLLSQVEAGQRRLRRLVLAVGISFLLFAGLISVLALR